MTEAINSLLVSSLFIAVLLSVEICKRRLQLPSELTRRIVHIAAGAVAILAYTLLPINLYVISVSAIGIIIASSQYKNIFSSIHNVKRHTYGEIFLPIGLLAALLVSVAEPAIYIPSVLVLTLSDSLAGLTSDLFKKQRKMIRGSLVFFITTVIILMLSTPLSWPALLFVSGLVTLIERYSKLGSDNLTVPLSVALLLTLF